MGRSGGRSVLSAAEPALTPGQLRARRRALGLSQAGLATALGVTANTLARWERGEVPMSKPALVRMGLERLGAPSVDAYCNAASEQATVSVPDPPSPHLPLRTHAGRA